MTENELKDLVAKANERLAAMSPQEREAMWQAQRENWALGELRMNEPSVLSRPAPRKQSSSELSSIAARFLSMDDDEMRKEAILKEHQVIGNPSPTTKPLEIRLEPTFCDLVRGLAASVLSQDEGKGE